MTKTALKNKTKRLKLRKLRIRKKVFGTAERPRLTLHCSNSGFYAQAIDDNKHETCFALSSSKLKLNDNKTNVAKALGLKFGKQLQTLKIKEVVFDRNGKLYHGRIKAFANAVRETGVKV